MLPAGAFMNRSHTLNSTQFFAVFALCCCLPIAAAKLALVFSWFSPSVSNNGRWLEKDMQLPLASGHWQLLYVQAEKCNGTCELALYSLQQLHTGLGAKREQVTVGLVAEQQPVQLVKYKSLRWQSTAMPAKLHGKLLLVNRQGQLLMHYDAANNPQEAILMSRKMRADLLRLLAFDRPYKTHVD
jgi:hypothetical protein